MIGSNSPLGLREVIIGYGWDRVILSRKTGTGVVMRDVEKEVFSGVRE